MSFKKNHESEYWPYHEARTAVTGLPQLFTLQRRTDSAVIDLGPAQNTASSCGSPQLKYGSSQPPLHRPRMV